MLRKKPEEQGPYYVYIVKINATYNVVEGNKKIIQKP